MRRAQAAQWFGALASERFGPALRSDRADLSLRGGEEVVCDKLSSPRQRGPITTVSGIWVPTACRLWSTCARKVPISGKPEIGCAGTTIIMKKRGRVGGTDRRGTGCAAYAVLPRAGGA